MVVFFGRSLISINLKVAYINAGISIQVYIFATSRIDYLTIHHTYEAVAALAKSLMIYISVAGCGMLL